MNDNTLRLLENTQSELTVASSNLKCLLGALRAIETADPKSQAIKIALDIALTSNVEIISECAYKVTISVEEDEVGYDYYE